jgi:hypothetical protein
MKTQHLKWKPTRYQLLGPRNKTIGLAEWNVASGDYEVWVNGFFRGYAGTKKEARRLIESMMRKP